MTFLTLGYFLREINFDSLQGSEVQQFNAGSEFVVNQNSENGQIMVVCRRLVI